MERPMRGSRMWALAASISLVLMSASPTTQSGVATTQSGGVTPPAAAGATSQPRFAAYKTEAAASIDGMYDLAQQMVDSVFSFSELGFQEFETQRYLTGILEKEGFTIQRG